MTLKTLLFFPLIISSCIVLGQPTRQKPILLGGTDTCAVTTAEKIYGGSGNDYASGILVTSDSGYLILGYTNSFGNGGYDGYVIKLDKGGGVQWSKTYGGPGDDEFTRVRATSDGGYILGGYTTSYGDPADAWLVKIDATGNLQWSKKYGDGNPYGERLFDLIQTADGGYAFCGDHKYNPGIVDAMVVRVDANGNLLWAKAFDSGGSDESAGIYEDRDSLVVSAFYQSSTGYDGVLMKIEETGGTISWLQSWDFDSRTNRLGFIYPQPGGYMIMGSNSDGFGVTNPWHNTVKTDFNGNLLSVQELNTTPTTMNGYIYPTTDGGYIIENDELVYDPNADLHFTKVANDGTFQWSRSYLQPGQQLQGGIVQTPDGGYAGIAYTNQGGANFHIILVKTDSTGQTGGCPNVAIPGLIRNPVVTNLTYSWPTKYDIAFNPSLSISPVVTSQQTADSALCQTVDLCLHLHLTGMDSICNWQNPVPYGSIRDSGCVSPIQWSVDNAYANIVTKTDSTIQLQYKQPGTVTLYGQIGSGCMTVLDSMPIQIYHTTPINLGNDTSFCPGGSVVLNAGSGFRSYAWSSGDTTQQIIDSIPGAISVMALNSDDNCLSADTMTIVFYPVPAVNIGPNTSLCRDSVYTFDAGSGFNSYLWQDGSSNSFFVASLPGAYWVTVTNKYGCAGSDTARILNIVENPKDFLQETTEICSRGQVPLQVNAIGNWTTYLWSSGSTGPDITITAPGLYWLQVSNAGGCTARDSLVVTGKTCPFGIFFPNAFTPNNDGNNDVFRPLVYAVLDKFYMAIYNRIGAKVFETNDPAKGWDGSINGQSQGMGTFVWYVRYQLQSAPGKDIVEKGTLELIR